MTIGEQELLVETRILERPETGPVRVRCHPRHAGRIVFRGTSLPGGVPFPPGYGVRDPQPEPPS